MSRVRQLLATSAVATSLVATMAAGAHAAAATSPSACLDATRVNSITATGSPFDGGTTLSWNVTPGCSEVVVTLGDRIGAVGSVVKNPEVTTRYQLVASMGKAKKLLANRYVVGGKVVEYYRLYGSLRATGPTGDDGAAAVEIAHKIASSLSEGAKAPLVGKSLQVHIIPSNVELTELPPWQHLAGTSTCDGRDGCVEDRPWSSVRGIGGTTAEDQNYIATAVGQEELVPVSGMPSRYGLGYVLAHEFSHVFLQFIGQSFRNSVQAVLDSRGPNADYLGIDRYTRSNIDEYWAEGSAALFRYAHSKSSSSIAEYTPEWLAANDPALLSRLNQIYPNR